MSFFRKAGVKIAASILCIASFTVTVVSGFLVVLLITAGTYDAGKAPFEHLVLDRMSTDSHRILFDYFDPNEPESPWKSYYAGGIYTGEDSNFVYQITDENGKPVLSTYNSKTPVILEQSRTHSFDSTEEVAVEDEYTVTRPVILIGSSYYLYDEDSNVFRSLEDYLGKQMNAQKLDADVFDLGFTFRDTHYGYAVDDSGEVFLPYEGFQNYAVTHTSASYTISYGLREGLPYPDIYRNLLTVSGALMGLRHWLIFIAAASLILGIALLSILGCAVGRVNGREEPVLGFLFRLPPDLSIFCMILVGALGLSLTIPPQQTTHLTTLVVWNVLAVLTVITLVVYGILTLCARYKTHTLITGSICYWIIHNIGRFFRWLMGIVRQLLSYLPLLWKVGVCYGVLCILELIGLAIFFWGSGTLYFIWFLEKLALGALVFYVTLCFRRLKTGAEHIAAGNYNTKVEEKHLVLDFKETADTLNHIQDGMTAAVESRMRSERLKTELITNVSHDLKTPLTSIVSYVDLLKQEPAGSQAAEEYLAVLDRQSQRLKKLIEDLVEASKASTGNIAAVKEPLDFMMLLGQALGEYSQRLTTAELTPVLHIPEFPVMVLADGRLLWRVFDNLLGNIVKYAMPGTRVYISADADSTVTATFRNISRDPLDVSPDELMERFVRGDASRHTEGSGLGLSIARSLTESMGGSFQLSVDGDLFKAMVSFPLLESTPTQEDASEPNA